MTGASFETHALVLVPLTPIHIGGGEEARLLPEDYRLRDGYAERIDLRAVLARLPEAERANWLRRVAGARGDQAVVQMRAELERLRSRATGADIRERIAISPKSAGALDPAGSGRDRRNQIDAFFRAGGRPVLPGSSVKGMLRTGWAAEMARRHGAPALPQLSDWLGMSPRKRARAAERALDDLLKHPAEEREQDTDPFRDVTVADAPLPDGATRIDAVQTWKRSRGDGAAARGAGPGWGFESRGEMHRERLRSVADGGAPPEVAVTVGLRAGWMRAAADCKAPERRPRPDRVPDGLASLLGAIEAHHAPLWKREVEEKFFAGPPGDRLRAALALFAALRRDGPDPEAALVRLGWAGHAEAKSLAGLRRIERPQAPGPGRIASEGSTRHVVALEGHPLPFGWALLVRADVWASRRPPAWLPPPAPRATPQAAAGRDRRPEEPRTGSALAGQLRYRRGSRVRVGGEVAELLEDVTEAMRPDTIVRIRIDGDIETIPVRDIEGHA